MKTFFCFLLALTLTLFGCASGTNPDPEVTKTVAPDDPDTETKAPDTNTDTEPSTDTATKPDRIDEIIASMTLEEKVGQLILVRIDSDPDTAIKNVGKYHVGGYVLFGSDFSDRNPATAADYIKSLQDASKIPLIIATDEEGGTVVRVSKYPQYRSSPFESPRNLLEKNRVESDTKERCKLLSSLGINLNLAPVADISTDKNDFIYYRSAGDVDAAVEYVKTFVESSEGVGTTLKHFPGYGGNADTHTGTATDTREREVFDTRDFLPFKAGIEAGADVVMVSHNTVVCMDKDNPASLSAEVHRVLREELGFDGIITTDDLAMDAISKVYGAGEAGVMAIEAGNDLVCCSDLKTKYDAILKAAKSGRITEERIDESLRRILAFKINQGIIE